MLGGGSDAIAHNLRPRNRNALLLLHPPCHRKGLFLLLLAEVSSRLQTNPLMRMGRMLEED